MKRGCSVAIDRTMHWCESGSNVVDGACKEQRRRASGDHRVPRSCRPLSLSSSPRGIAGTARGTMQLVSLLLYMMAVRGGALVRRWLPCR